MSTYTLPDGRKVRTQSSRRYVMFRLDTENPTIVKRSNMVEPLIAFWRSSKGWRIDRLDLLIIDTVMGTYHHFDPATRTGLVEVEAY